MFYVQSNFGTQDAPKWKNPSGLTGKQLSSIDYQSKGMYVYYFSGDEEADGSMKTGTYKIDLDDDTYTFTFDKHGCGLNGVNSNKVYVNGMLLTAGDDRYAVVNNIAKGADEKDAYLVSATGSIIKGGKYVKDANDDYYAVFNSDSEYTIWKIKDGDNASKAAKDLANNGSASDYVGTAGVQQVFPAVVE